MELIDYLNRYDRFAAASGVRLTEMGDGRAVAVMTVTETHVNGANVCQGGALFTLADLAFAAAVNGGGRMTVGTSCNITFFRSALMGDTLTAEAVQHDHPKLPFCEVRVFNQHGELVSMMTGSAYRRKVPILPDEAQER